MFSSKPAQIRETRSILNAGSLKQFSAIPLDHNCHNVVYREVFSTGFHYAISPTYTFNAAYSVVSGKSCASRRDSGKGLPALRRSRRRGSGVLCCGTCRDGLRLGNTRAGLSASRTMPGGTGSAGNSRHHGTVSAAYGCPTCRCAAVQHGGTAALRSGRSAAGAASLDLTALYSALLPSYLIPGLARA